MSTRCCASEAGSTLVEALVAMLILTTGLLAMAELVRLAVASNVRARRSSVAAILATQKIEELIHNLKNEYTIVIVTHNMQQAARVSDYTAFFYMGELIELDETDIIFTNPTKKQTEDYITGRFG